MSDILSEPKGDFAVNAFFAWWEIFQGLCVQLFIQKCLTQQHPVHIILLIDIFRESDLNVWVLVGQDSFPMVVPPEVKALLANILSAHARCWHSKHGKKKKSDNLQYTATLKSRSQVPAQTAFHYLPLVDYVKNFFFKKEIYFFYWNIFISLKGI